MNATVTNLKPKMMNPGWIQIASELATSFAERGAENDSNNQFVSENYKDLKENAFFSMIIPEDLGGGGASFEQTCGVIRTLATGCGSTALAYSMHTHPVAINVFKHLRGDEKASATLKKIAENNLVIAGTGANDWLSSSGSATKVEGGYRVTAKKHFVSGSPGAQVFVTSATIDSEVIHFAIPFSSEGVTHYDNWNTIGMRSTGSNDISMDNVFVAEDSVVLRRPVGEWHPVWDAIIPTAMPLIMSTYVGLADAAVQLATTVASKRPAELAGALGEMLNCHASSVLALEDMIRKNDNHGFVPSKENSSEILTRKTLLTISVQKTVDLAAEIIGGPGFYKGHPLERIRRDVLASHFHPLPYRRQYAFSGRVALGLDPVNG